MSANAHTFTELNGLLRPAAPVARAEHISIESEPEAVAAPQRQHTVCSSFTLTTTLRDRATRVAILQDHLVSIRQERAHAAPLEYMLDLRFVDPKPVHSRRIAWNWLWVALGMLTLSAGSMALAPRPWPLLLVSPGFGVGLVFMLAMLGALLKFVRGTTESLQFLSEHGGAPLIVIRGGLGSTRRGRRFFVEIIKNIRAAKQARPQPKPLRLRDEMREHHRLRELKVLTEADYEASKARILKAHA